MAGFYRRVETFARTISDAHQRLLRDWQHGTLIDQGPPLLLDASTDGPLLSVNLTADLLAQEIDPLEPTAGPYGQLLELGGRAVAACTPPGCSTCARRVPTSWSPRDMIDRCADAAARWLYFLGALALAENVVLWNGGVRPLSRAQGGPAPWLERAESGALDARLRASRWEVADRADPDGPGNRALELGRFLLAAREATGVASPGDRASLARVLERYDCDTRGQPSSSGRMKKGLEARRMVGSALLLEEVVKSARAREPLEVELLRIERRLGLLGEPPSDADRSPRTDGGKNGAAPHSPGVSLRLAGAFGAHELHERLLDACEAQDRALSARQVNALVDDFLVELSEECRARGIEVRPPFTSALRQLGAARGDELDEAFRRGVERVVRAQDSWLGRAVRGWLQATRPGLAAAAAVGAGAAALVAVLASRPAPDALHEKGGAAWVTVARGGDRFALGDGPLHEGDVLRFRSDPLHPYALVLGVERPGEKRLYVSAPDGTSLPVDREWRWLPVGARLRGIERFFLVTSDTPIDGRALLEQIDCTQPGFFTEQDVALPLDGMAEVRTWLIEPSRY